MQRKRSSAEQATRARQVTVQLLTSAERDGFFVDHELERVLLREALPRRDRALVTMLVNGVTRMRQRLDFEIANYYKKDYERAPLPLKNILRTAFYQNEFLDRVPDYAIVFESVNLAKKYFGEERGNLVNAILRERQRRPMTWPPQEALARDLDRLAAYLSHPRWLLEKWLSRMPLSEVIALAEANNRIPAVTLRVVHPERNAREFGKHLRTWNIPVETLRQAPHFHRLGGGIDINSLAAIKQGLCVVQDISAGLAARLMAARAGEQIYDWCAAPGGKAILMAESGAAVTAVEIHAKRARLIEESSAKLGVPVRVLVADATSFEGEPANGVLVDAPCSGLGVLAKRADLRWQRKKQDITELQSLQLRLLENAARLVKPGGRLVYSTCTIEPEENELVIDEFLRGHLDFRMRPAGGFVDKSFCDDRGFIKTMPHVHGTDGSFAARLQRASESDV